MLHFTVDIWFVNLLIILHKHNKLWDCIIKLDGGDLCGTSVCRLRSAGGGSWRSFGTITRQLAPDWLSRGCVVHAAVWKTKRNEQRRRCSAEVFSFLA